MAKIKNKKDASYFQEVSEHKKKVMDIMFDLAHMIMKRAYVHDDSKIQDEFDLWVEHYIPESERDIESDEYNKEQGLISFLLTRVYPPKEMISPINRACQINSFDLYFWLVSFTTSNKFLSSACASFLTLGFTTLSSILAPKPFTSSNSSPK